ncbi:MAG: hypothetical protein OEZ47_11355 [Gammaproteobacteria bacterium]|nr:hypothetical protein [Gammaproteobacteria bacterium]
MKQSASHLSSKTSIAALVIAGLLIVLAALYTPNKSFNEAGDWFSVVPAVVTIVMAIVTHRLLLSLISGIVLTGLILPFVPTHEGGFAIALYYPFKAVAGVVFDWWSIKVAAFVVLILMMISVAIVGGGLRGIALYLERFAKDAKSSQLVTAVLGIIIFIDDYANTMIVGSAMRPLTDRHRVSREKLAFLVDATSAPIAGLAVVSTWIAFEVALFQQVSDDLQLGLSGYNLFFDAVVYRFYCLFLLLFVFLNILTQRDFGFMYSAQFRAATTGELVDPQSGAITSNEFESIHSEADVQARIRTALVPFIVLIGFFVCGLWISGGGLALMKQSVTAFLELVSWRQVLGKSDNSTVLLIATSSSLLTALYFAKSAGAKTDTLMQAMRTGLKSSLLPISILFLAWALKNGFSDLKLGAYLVHTVGDVLSVAWFPALVFITAALVSFGTGTSWGTMSLLIPIALPLAYSLDQGQYGLIMILSIAAVLDGAIFGDHCSPVSDTTIMSSIASSCDHLDHVKTQLPYALFTGFLAVCCAYLPIALGVPYYAAWILALVLMLATLYLLGKQVVGGAGASHQ